MPKPAPQIEHKTINTTLLAGVLGIALAALNGLEADSQLINWLPATWQAIVLAMVPMIVTAVTGYLTPHTERTDLASPQIPAPQYGGMARGGWVQPAGSGGTGAVRVGGGSGSGGATSARPAATNPTEGL